MVQQRSHLKTFTSKYRFMIDVSNIMLSDKVSCNNRKDWWDIVSYQVDKAAIITLFTKKPINMFSYSVFQYDK